MIGGEIVLIGGPKAHETKFRPFLKEALQLTIRHWHEQHLPRHFERSAYGRYHYQRRTAKHELRKLRKYGHQDPLRFSGRLMREVTSRIRISGTARMAQAALRGPRYLYQFRKDRKAPDKAVELRKTTRKEEREMGDFLDRYLTERLNSDRTRETIRI